MNDDPWTEGLFTIVSLLFKLHLYLAMAYSLCHFMHTCIPQECGLPCVYKCHALVSFHHFASLPSDSAATMKVLLLLAVLPLVSWAQFPAACNTSDCVNNNPSGNPTGNPSGDPSGNPSNNPSNPNSEISNFRVPLHLIMTAGAFVLMVLNIFGM